MNNPAPDLLSQASPQRGELSDYSLWRNAPAWRNLVIGAAGLTAFTVATPFLSRTNELAVDAGKAVAEPQSSCPLKPGPIFPGSSGKVVGFLLQEQAQTLTQRTEAQLQAKLNPAFVNNLRAVITPEGTQSRLVALVPATMAVNIGDQVVFTGGYKDPSLPCHYMPNLISKIISPAAPAGDVPSKG